MLTLEQVTAGYGRLEALHGISLDVPEGRVVALLGGNGAGKSTTLRTIVGLLRAKSGRIAFKGRRIDDVPAHRIVASGIAMVPQGRELFAEMSVAENLELGSLTLSDKASKPALLDEVLGRFPRLRERAAQRAGTLSGG